MSISSSSEAIIKPIIPHGLSKLIDACHNIYPNQPNPLQATTVLKYWLGGQEPLDYISMYYNSGNADLNIPSHWHYISFGLSDLHGDGRVHPVNSTGNDEPRSGMGFELTFRLLIKDEDRYEINDCPPTWPANLLQSLARYVFKTGNRLCAGDNIPWRKSLDGADSSIQHMLISNDPQMQRFETEFGWVDFCQIVGVTEEELEHASRWNGKGILDLLQKDSITGGEWLITDMNRSSSVFELFPGTLQQLENDLENQGSDLAGINAEFTFKELQKTPIKTEIDSELLNQQYLENETDNKVDVKVEKVTSTTSPFEDEDDRKFLSTLSVNNSLNMSCPLDNQPIQSQPTSLTGLQLIIAPYAAKFLVLAIKDRVRHGRHFTFKSECLAITFLAESVTGSIVSKTEPYSIIGYWLQVMITNDLLNKMLESFQCLNGIRYDKIELPKIFEWPDNNLEIIIDNIYNGNMMENV